MVRVWIDHTPNVFRLDTDISWQRHATISVQHQQFSPKGSVNYQ